MRADIKAFSLPLRHLLSDPKTRRSVSSVKYRHTSWFNGPDTFFLDWRKCSVARLRRFVHEHPSSRRWSIFRARASRFSDLHCCASSMRASSSSSTRSDVGERDWSSHEDLTFIDLDAPVADLFSSSLLSFARSLAQNFPNVRSPRGSRGAQFLSRVIKPVWQSRKVSNRYRLTDC